MESFIKHCQLWSWAIAGISVLNLTIEHTNLTFGLAILHVFVQTARLLMTPKKASHQSLWYSLSVLFGVAGCFCLATSIGNICSSDSGDGSLMPLKYLMIIYTFIGIVFPILYFFLISVMIKIETYWSRGIFLIMWVIVAIIYFEQVVNHLSHKKELECPTNVSLPLMNCIILTIVFLYGIYLIRLDKENAL